MVNIKAMSIGVSVIVSLNVSIGVSMVDTPIDIKLSNFEIIGK